MKSISAVPEWFGYLLLILVGVFIFPSIGHMIEGYNSQLWEIKSSSMGVFYPYAILIWSTITLPIYAVIVVIGVIIIRTSDPDNE